MLRELMEACVEVPNFYLAILSSCDHKVGSICRYVEVIDLHVMCALYLCEDHACSSGPESKCSLLGPGSHNVRGARLFRALSNLKYIQLFFEWKPEHRFFLVPSPDTHDILGRMRSPNIILALNL